MAKSERPEGRDASLVSPRSSKSPLERADALLRKMTLDEKVMQLSAVYPMALLGSDGPIRSQLDARLKRGIGHVSGLGTMGHKAPEVIASTVNAIQRYLVNETRLGIPAIFHNEALNGVVAPHFTHFPTSIALAATWDPDAVEEMAEILRRQLRSVGLLQALSPVMDVARDPRWGRVHETYGEDPYLVTAMSVAFTRGMQGDDLRRGVLATAKHFLGYAMTEGGQNMAATAITARELRDVYARPFEAAIRLAGLGSVMASYSEYDGVPIHISREVLTELLRGELGFTGTVVSDYVGVAWARTRQRAAASSAEVGVLALQAGLDVELPIVHGYGEVLANAVRSGTVSETQVDESVRRVLRDKFALGLFDDPYVRGAPAELRSLAAEGGELSQRLAAASVTLLKNDDALLPLRRDVAKIAILGPHAHSAIAGFSAYTYPAALQMLLGRIRGGETSMAGADASDAFVPPDAAAAMAAEFQPFVQVELEDYVRSLYGAVSLADAIRALLPNAEVTVVAGTGFVPSESTDLPAAVAAARAADVVILAVGGRCAWFGGDVTEGEGRDTANVDLPPQQLALIDAVTALGKPTVAVVTMGRPYGLAPVIDRLPAVVAAFYGGPHHGRAIADALFGVTSPEGKLPFSIPRHAGQVPTHHAQKTGSGYRRNEADIHKGYLDMPSTPLFPFGHGLGYTTFEYATLELESARVDTAGELRVSLAITNTGKRRGTEIVQLYASDTATGITRPAQQLIGFARVDLEPGATKRVAFVVPLSMLAYTGIAGQLLIEPGPITLTAGSSSSDLRSNAEVEVTGRTLVVLREQRAFLSSATVGAS